MRSVSVLLLKRANSGTAINASLLLERSWFSRPPCHKSFRSLALACKRMRHELIILEVKKAMAHLPPNGIQPSLNKGPFQIIQILKVQLLNAIR